MTINMDWLRLLIDEAYYSILRLTDFELFVSFVLICILLILIFALTVLSGPSTKANGAYKKTENKIVSDNLNSKKPKLDIDELKKLLNE